MIDENKYQYKYLNNYGTNPNDILPSNERIPHFQENSFDNTMQSNYRKDAENILNSVNNNNPEQKNFSNTSRTRSRSPCLCDCHKKNLQSQTLLTHCHHHHITHIPHIHHILAHTHIPNNNINTIPINDEVNKINDDLFNEVNELKKEYSRIKNELDRTKNEKEASTLYIKELENEVKNQNNILMNTQKQKNSSSVNTKNIGRYHEMLNKSFEVLDSVSNKCDDYKAKIHGDTNYYYNKEPDYTNLIDAQKQWLENLPEKTNNNLMGSVQSEQTPSNMFGNSGNFGDSNLNVFLNPENNQNQGNLFNDINKNPQQELINVEENDSNNYNNDFNKNLINGKKINNNKKMIFDKSNDYINNNIPNNQNVQSKNYIPNLIIDDQKYPNDNAVNIPLPTISQKKTKNKIPQKKNINNQYNNNKQNQNFSNKKFPKKNNNIKNNIKQEQLNPIQTFGPNKKNSIPKKPKNKNNKKKQNFIYNKDSSLLNERCLIVDENGNPIYIEGQRLLGMEITPLLDENDNEVLDDNGNIILIGPDGETKTQNDLEPIILDNDLPLVNEDNKPFLGINGVPLINGYGNPVLGPGELYDKNNKVVVGQLAIIPKDGFGNLIKVDLNGELIGSTDDNNNFNNNNEISENENYINDLERNNIRDFNDYNDNNNYNNDNNNYNDYNNNYNNVYNDNNNDYNNDYNDDYNNNYNNNNDFNNVYNDNIDNNNNDYNGNEDNNEDSGDNNNDNVEFDINNLKPLIGKDGRPVRDPQNNPIMLDLNNRPIKGTGITVLLDQTGRPVYNSEGEAILINKDGQPINLIDINENNNDNDNNENNYNQQNPYYPKKDDYVEFIKINNYNNKNQPNNNRKGRFEKSEPRGKYYYPEKFKRNNNIDYSPNKTTEEINYFPGSCFACEAGCGISVSGYSPMTYSPYNKYIRRREYTPLRRGTEYTQYYKYKQRRYSGNERNNLTEIQG